MGLKVWELQQEENSYTKVNFPPAAMI